MSWSSVDIKIENNIIVHEPEIKILDIGVISGNLVWLNCFNLDVWTTHFNMIACSKWPCLLKTMSKVSMYISVYFYNVLLYFNY